MKTKLSNKLLMYWAVLEVLDKFNALWATATAFAAAYNNFKAAVTQIQNTAKLSGMKTENITAGKNAAVKSFTVKLFKVTSLMLAYANATKNADLKNKVDYAESELDDMRPDELLNVTEDVVEEFDARKAALTDYNLDETDMEPIRAFLATFKKTTTATRTTITTRKAANERLRPQFADASVILKEQLENLMEKFRETNPDFYGEFWAARGIVDAGTRHDDKDDKPDEPEK